MQNINTLIGQAHCELRQLEKQLFEDFQMQGHAWYAPMDSQALTAALDHVIELLSLARERVRLQAIANQTPELSFSA